MKTNTIPSPADCQVVAAKQVQNVWKTNSTETAKHATTEKYVLCGGVASSFGARSE